MHPISSRPCWAHTPPSSGRSKGRFASFGPPLMSNVRPHIFKAVSRHRPRKQNSGSAQLWQNCKLPKKRPRSTSMSSRTQQTGLPGGGKRNQEQRNYVRTHQRQAGNYSLKFCSCPTKIIPVRGWRFAPACCAAQSVLRRGPSCAMPLHQLAWAALNFHRHGELHQPSASAGSMKTVHALVSFAAIRRQAAKVVRPNHSLNRTHCGGPSFGR